MKRISSESRANLKRNPYGSRVQTTLLDGAGRLAGSSVGVVWRGSVYDPCYEQNLCSGVCAAVRVCRDVVRLRFDGSE